MVNSGSSPPGEGTGQTAERSAGAQSDTAVLFLSRDARELINDKA